MGLRATAIIPTYDHGPTLNLSIPTALDQTVSDIEVFVIGDGVPDVTRSIVAEFARMDERVRFFDHPKGPRHGEIYRHAALQEAKGEIVCYLADDDLWLPDHIESLLELLQEADFAHTCPARLEEDGSMWIYPGDLVMHGWRSAVLAGRNFIPFSMGGHTLESYRRLPHGWRTTPRGTPTDLYMWQQLLSEPWCRAVSGSRPTVLNFPASLRPGASVEERVDELEAWARRRDDPDWRGRFVLLVLDFLYRERAGLVGRIEAVGRPPEELAAENAALKAQLDEAYGTATWRMRTELLESPGLGRLIRWRARRRRGHSA